MAFFIVAKAIGVWCAILILAIANGIFRESVLIPLFGMTTGLIGSGIILCTLIITLAYIALPWLRLTASAGYFLIGLCWLFLTLVFEFTLGYLVQGKPLPELLAAYTFKDGNIWPIVLLVTVLAPYIAAKIRCRYE